jgi:hypothetical protein
MRQFIKRVSIFLITTLQVYGLEEKPWFYPPYNFHTKAAFEASFFTNVDNGFNPIGYHSTNFEAVLGFLAPISSTFDAEIEVELQSTSMTNFGFESAVLQVRKLLLNDIMGDFLSLDLGANIRAVPKQRLRDVAVPYHDLWNFELSSAIGKEFTKEEDWLWRVFVLGAVGQANRGYPWIKAMFSAFLNSYFGLGKKTLIDVRHFDGYGMYKHQSIDVGATFTVFFEVLGSLTLAYTHRFLANTYPEDYNSFLITYDLPFSF